MNATGHGHPSVLHHRPAARSLLPFALGLAAVLAAGCSSEARKARHLARGEDYFKQDKYPEAVIEYMNVLRMDRNNPQAIRQLGVSYYRLNDFRKAFPFLLKTTELAPEDSDIRMKVGAILLAGRQAERAREQAAAVLKYDPGNLQALLMFADASVQTNGLAEAEAVLEAARASHAAEPLYHVARGNLRLRARDLAGAEKAYLEARAADPKRPEANMALASLYHLKGDLAAADAAYAAAGAALPPGSPMRLKHAAFKLATGRLDEAEALARAVSDAAPDLVPAWALRAEIAFARHDIDACQSLLDKSLKQQPGNPSLLLLQANVHLARRETDRAIELLQKLLQEAPDSHLLRYRLALARLQKREVQSALNDLEQVVKEAPSFLDAAMTLYELKVRMGKADEAVPRLEALSARHPDSQRILSLLAGAYRAAGKHEQAVQTYRKLVDMAPADPRVKYLRDITLRAAGREDEAREGFAAVLAGNPGFVPALAQLVSIDLAAGRKDAALARVDEQIAKAPDQAGLHYLRATVMLTRKEPEAAEVSLLKAIELQPDFVGSYLLLSRLYASTGKDDQALAKLEAALKVQPDSMQSLMLTALLHHRRGDIAKACETYERLLKRYPDATAAANNLAVLYSAQPAKLDRALELAQMAREQAPGDPYIADTLGWVLHRRGDNTWALTVLRESAEQQPDIPEIRYHLGMTLYALGDDAAALAQLERATAEGAHYDGVEEARHLAAVLRIDPETAGAGELAALDAALADDPRNAAALFRKAAVRRRAGELEEAATLYRAAAEANPQYAPAFIGLATVLGEGLGRFGDALAPARKARELRPDDPAVAGMLGWILNRTGDQKWALTLLQDASRREPGNVRLLYRLGLTQYMRGDLAAAGATVRRAVAAGDFSDKAEAQQFLALLAHQEQAAQLKTVPDEVGAVLAKDPANVPALMVTAMVAAQTGRREEAIAACRSVLKQAAEFPQAMALLAGLYADDPGKRAEAFELASKARELLPKDTGTASTLGRLAYGRGDYEYAVQLLTGSVAAKVGGSTDQYLLGLSQHKLKKAAAAAETLRAALAADPASPYATEAKAALAGD